MVEETKNFIIIDLNQFKLHLYLKPEVELTLHFDSPSRKFYLSVIGFVAYAMKKRGRITSISLHEHLDVITLLNETVGASAGSSKKEHLFPRIYRKWKDVLPDLENAPLFKVVGRKKRYDESMEKVYEFSESEKDRWANLFEYKGSHENVGLRFSIDRLGSNLDDVIIEYGKYPELKNAEAWEGFIAHLKNDEGNKSKPDQFNQYPKQPNALLVQQKQGPKAIPKKLRRLTLCTIGLFVFGVAVFVIWNTQIFAPQVEVASVEKVLSPVPEKRSIVVLPLRNLSSDPKQEYFSDGMTEDLITDLSKISGLFVIGRNSSFTYKGKSIKNRQIAEELGVRYILEGSVRKIENTVRINVQLIDATTGRPLWAERYDKQMDDIFSLQDKITQKIVETLAVKLTIEENEAIPKRKTDNLEAYLTFLKGWQHYRQFNPDAFLKAIPLFERATELDPNYWHVYAALAKIYLEAYQRPPWLPRMELNRTDAISRTNKYLKMAMNGPTPLAHIVAAEIHMDVGNFQESIDEAEMAVSLDPNDPDSHFTLGLALVHDGRHKESVDSFKRAIRFDPFYQDAYGFGLGMAYFFMSEFEKASNLFERSYKSNPEDGYPLWYLIATYAHLDHQREAEAAIAKVRELNPTWPNLYVLQLAFKFKDPKDFGLLADGMRKVGVK